MNDDVSWENVLVHKIIRRQEKSKYLANQKRENTGGVSNTDTALIFPQYNKEHLSVLHSCLAFCKGVVCKEKLVELSSETGLGVKKRDTTPSCTHTHLQGAQQHPTVFQETQRGGMWRSGWVDMHRVATSNSSQARGVQSRHV